MDAFEKIYKELENIRSSRKKGKKQDNLMEVIFYALDQERDEYEFYVDLAKRVESKDLKKRMIKQAKEELLHGQKLLELIKGDCLPEYKKRQQDMPELHVADYAVPAPPKDKKLSYQDALILAIKKEQANLHLYQDLAKISLCPDSRKLFQFLMAQESKHLASLEKEYDENILKED
ncbi:MAG: ferritin family protein [Magnetococcales bacterium]|nr:ferritin family protein [Magnetococcales bacterium]